MRHYIEREVLTISPDPVVAEMELITSVIPFSYNSKCLIYFP